MTTERCCECHVGISPERAVFGIIPLPLRRNSTDPRHQPSTHYAPSLFPDPLSKPDVTITPLRIIPPFPANCSFALPICCEPCDGPNPQRRWLGVKSNSLPLAMFRMNASRSGRT